MRTEITTLNTRCQLAAVARSAGGWEAQIVASDKHNTRLWSEDLNTKACASPEEALSAAQVAFGTAEVQGTCRDLLLRLDRWSGLLGDLGSTLNELAAEEAATTTTPNTTQEKAMPVSTDKRKPRHFHCAECELEVWVEPRAFFRKIWWIHFAQFTAQDSSLAAARKRISNQHLRCVGKLTEELVEDWQPPSDGTLSSAVFRQPVFRGKAA